MAISLRCLEKLCTYSLIQYLCNGLSFARLLAEFDVERGGAFCGVDGDEDFVFAFGEFDGGGFT